MSEVPPGTAALGCGLRRMADEPKRRGRPPKLEKDAVAFEAAPKRPVKGRSTNLSPAEVIEVAESAYELAVEHRGNLSKIAHYLGFTRGQLVAVRDKYPNVATALKEADAAFHDAIAEVLLRGAVQDPGFGRTHSDAIYLSKALMGWHETNVVRHEGFQAPPEDVVDGPGGKPSLTVVDLSKVAAAKESE